MVGNEPRAGADSTVSVPHPAKQDLQRSVADSQPRSLSWQSLSPLSLVLRTSSPSRLLPTRSVKSRHRLCIQTNLPRGQRNHHSQSSFTSSISYTCTLSRPRLQRTIAIKRLANASCITSLQLVISKRAPFTEFTPRQHVRPSAKGFSPHPRAQLWPNAVLLLLHTSGSSILKLLMQAFESNWPRSARLIQEAHQ